MDPSEYTIADIKLSDDEKEKINEYNKKYTRKALEILKYNRDKLLGDTKYAQLSIEDRVKHVYEQDEFKEFCMTYPLVSKFIVAFGLFNSKAFVKYLDWKAKIRPSDGTRAKLIGNQREQEKFKNKYIYAIYVKYLYTYKGDHTNLEEINKVYHSVVEELNKETDHFFDTYEKLEKEQKEKEGETLEFRKKKLVEQLRAKLNN